MNFKEMVADDLPLFYETLSTDKAIYNGKTINVFFEEDYDFETAKDKTIKVQLVDVQELKTGEAMTIESISYKVVNFKPVHNSPHEILIALDKV